MNIDVLASYTVVAFFYITSPGPAIFLAISNGITSNMKIVMASSLANIIGLFILSAVSMSGLGAILLASSTLFIVIKMIGAIYLIYLGIMQFKKVNKSLVIGKEQENETNRNYLSYFNESLFLAITNPKPILFFTALFPQFINIEAPIMPQFFIMTTIFMFISFSSLSSYGYMAKSAKHWFMSQRRMSVFHKVTGGVFITMGVGLLQLRSNQS
ncbi:MAG: LysE family translocator [Candidatus Sedimenticola sp. (ex Thyasira tokunagai)]